MSDPIDDMVAEDILTHSVADKLASGVKYIFAKVSYLFGRSANEQHTTDEASEVSTQADLSAKSSSTSPTETQTPVKHGPHVSHPYCISEPRNPFVEDISKDWSFPSERTTKHILDRELK